MCGYRSAGPAGAADWSLTVITRQSETPGALSLSFCRSVQLKMDSHTTTFMSFFKCIQQFAFTGLLKPPLVDFLRLSFNLSLSTVSISYTQIFHHQLKPLKHAISVNERLSK